MSVLSSLLSRRPSRERPDLAAWVADARPLLVVDGGLVVCGDATRGDDVDRGGGSVARFAGATVLEHATSGAPGLPFFDRDPRRLPAKDGEFRAVVLAEVLDRVLDVAPAVDEARRALAPGGLLLVVQSVAPEGHEERAIWNAVARMRDARHTSTPSARQLALLLSSWRMEAVREAEWEETSDPLATRRPEVLSCLALMLDAARTRGTAVLRDGALVIARRATLLRKG